MRPKQNIHRQWSALFWGTPAATALPWEVGASGWNPYSTRSSLALFLALHWLCAWLWSSHLTSLSLSALLCIACKLQRCSWVYNFVGYSCIPEATLTSAFYCGETFFGQVDPYIERHWVSFWKMFSVLSGWSSMACGMYKSREDDHNSPFWPFWGLQAIQSKEERLREVKWLDQNHA